MQTEPTDWTFRIARHGLEYSRDAGAYSLTVYKAGAYYHYRVCSLNARGKAITAYDSVGSALSKTTSPIEAQRRAIDWIRIHQGKR